MVNATVDNPPVSVNLDSGQSTTVPSNETWRVSIHLANRQKTRLEINGINEYIVGTSSAPATASLLDVTLTGGETIAETQGDFHSGIFITGFVVDS
jgi:hypothetical protein